MAENATFTWGDPLPALECSGLTLRALAASDVWGIADTRSLRLLEHLGFRREGLLRQRYHVAGEVQDAVLLGLLRPDWRGRANTP